MTDHLLPESESVARFVDIATARTVKRAIDLAVSLGQPVSIVGPSGTGKTTALKHFSNLYGAIYCRVRDFNKNTIGAARTLIAAYGIRTDAKQSAEMWEVLYSRVGPSPLFVDEWQNFEPVAQREVLELAEQCRAPLVVSGNGEALRTRTNRGALEQINTRISTVFQTQRLTRDDAISICLDWNVEGAAERELVWCMAQAMTFRELNLRLVAARGDRGDAGSIRLANLATAINAIDEPTKARLLLKGKAA